MRRRYQDLAVWVKAMQLVELCYGVSSRLPPAERYELARQIRRSAVSIPSNIAEGHGRLHRADFAHHLSVASGSLRELETQLLIAVRLAYVPSEDLGAILDLVDEVGRMISGLIRAVRSYRAPA